MTDTLDEIDTKVEVEADTEQTTARDRPKIFGILNVTPDSFSDGGQWNEPDDAIRHAVELHESGADIIDVGGESTRPGADPVDEDEEHDRVIDIVRALVERNITVSVDTMRASTAALAIEAGASIINDVSGGQNDPEMFRLIAASDVDYSLMHWRGLTHRTGQFENVVAEVRDDLKYRLAELIIWGADPSRIILDPGIGFGKTADENWALLGHLDELATLQQRVLVGVSRKRLLAPFAEPDAAPAERDAATATLSALAAQAGVWAVRVHNVDATRATLDVWQAWERGSAL